MDWTAAVANPQALAQLPGDVGAQPVDLHEVIVHRDGPRVRLRFDVAAVPQPLPARWDGDANRTQVQLACFGVSALTLSGFTTTMCGRLTMRPAAGAWEVEFRAGDVVLTLHTSLVRVESLSGYHDAGEEC
jgi:hypothetical protein